MNKNENVEIEKKFLVKDIPFDLSEFKSSYIRQAYISIDPVIRLRQKDDDYIFTFKGRGQVKRTEFEDKLSKTQFLKLWEKIEGIVIEKTRYFIPFLADFGDYKKECVAELDIYDGELSGFKSVEVEFESENDANNFKPPVWFGEDVSLESKYKNSSMSIFGLNL